MLASRSHTRQTVVRRALTMLLAMLACALTTMIAAAAPQPVLMVDVGHAGAIRPGHYFPIRVNVQWMAEPGEAITGEAFAARLEVVLPQDELSLARISRDVTIQPGRGTTAVVYARVLSDVSEIEVELRERRGRLLARAKPSSIGPAGWWTIESSHAVLLAVGRSSLPRSGWAFVSSTASPVHVAELNAADLPREWPGYDAVSAVVLGDLGADHLDAEQVRTLLEWVERGGHLAVLVADQVESFSRALGGQRWPVALGEYRDAPFDAAVSTALARALVLAIEAPPPPPRASGSTLRSATTTTVVQPMEWYEPNLAALQDSVRNLEGRYLYRRPIRVAAEGAEAGWSARWSHEAFDPSGAASGGAGSAEGDIITGPFGLGTITLLGIDPANLAGAAKGDARGLAWWHCLAHLPPIHRAVTPRRQAQVQYWYGQQSDFESILASRAVNSILDDVSMDFRTTQGLFAAIAMALLLLVALIGPVDYFVLRRLGREPLTWITTPALIALACGAIYLAQNAVSYGSARAARLSVVDAWSGAGEGFATSFTAVASNRGGRYALDGLAEGVFSAPACWTPPYWYYRNQQPSTTVGIHQSAVGSRIVSMRIPIENVRWTEDRGPLAIPVFSGAVRKSAARDEVVLDLQGPQGTMGRVVGVWWNERWYAGATSEMERDLTTIAGWPIPRANGDDEALQRRRQPEILDSWVYYQNTWEHGWTHDLAFQIPGHRHVESRLTAIGPHLAAVLLELKPPPAVQLLRDGSPTETQWRETVLVRLIVPAQHAASATEGSQP